MKRILLSALFLLSVMVIFSCGKSGTEPDIKAYDQQQMQVYMANNGLTDMHRDTSGGDTTGTYYKITNVGTGAKVDYPDEISIVYTVRSFDGKYISTDTIVNHYDGYLGHITQSTFPYGLMIAIRNIMKTKGTQARLLIPSHLAFGVSGIGSGSKTITTGRIAGNQCLDYSINLIDSQPAYDDQVIKSYMASNNLSGYTQTTDGLYYKMTTVGTGISVNSNSSIVANYSTRLMNNTWIDSTYKSAGTYTFNDLDGGVNIAGFSEGLKLIKSGGAISLLIPSRLAYGTSGTTGVSSNSCLRIEIANTVVTNY